MSGRTFQLSRETKRLLGENIDFFDSLKPTSQELGLGLKGGDAEAHTEAEVLAGGDVQVTFVFPIDNNSDPADGRIYLKDSFVFDPKEQELKNYQRHFELKGDAQNNPQWKEWAAKYRAKLPSDPLESLNPRVKDFALLVARSYSRPITNAVREALKGQADYLKKVLLASSAEGLGFNLKLGDPQAHYHLVRQGDKLEITLGFPLDTDADPANGRVFFSDTFSLDMKSRRLEKVTRDWRVAPEVNGEIREQLQATVDRLNKQASPTVEEAQPYLQAVIKELLKPPEKDAAASSAATLEPFETKSLPQDYQSPLTRKARRKTAAESAGAQIALEALTVLTEEQLERRVAKSRGWLSAAALEESQEKHLLAGFIAKAQEAAKQNPAAGLETILLSLTLDESEEALRKQLLADPLYQRLQAISREPNDEVRSACLITFAREDLMKKEGLGQTAMFLAGKLSSHPTAGREANRLVTLVNGTGTTGTKVEFLLPHLLEELGSPGMIAAMMVAPFAGATAESIGLGIANVLYKGEKVGGLAIRTASGLGIAAEGAGFTTMHKAIDSATHDPRQVFSTWGKETASAILLFGLMRLAHGSAAWLGGKAAKGHFGEWAADLNPSLEFAVAPTGRVVIPARAYNLSSAGQTAVGALNHLGGVGSMYAANHYSQKWGWTPKNSQGIAGNLFDAVLSYTHAMVGFRIANGLSGGRLHPEIADVRLRLQRITEPPSAPFTLHPTDDAVGIGPFNWLKERVARDKLAHLRDRLRVVREERDEKTTEAADLGERLDRTEKELGETKEAKGLMEKEVLELRPKIPELSQKVSDLEEQLGRSKGDVRELTEESAELKGELDAVREQAGRELRRALAAEQMNKVLESGLQNARDEINRSIEAGFKKLEEGGGTDAALAEFRKSFEAANQQIDSLRGDLERKSEELNIVQMQLDAKAKGLLEIRKELEELRIEHGRISADRSEVKRVAQLAAEEARTHKDRAQQTDKVNETLRGDLEAERGKREGAEKKLEEANQQHEADQEALAGLNQRIAKLEADADEYQRALSDGLEQASAQKQVLEQHKEALDREKRNLEARVRVLEEEKKQAIELREHGLDDKNKELAGLTERLTQAESAVRRLSAEAGQKVALAAKVVELQGHVTALKQAFERKQDEHRGALQSASDNAEVARQLGEDVSRLQKRVVELEAALSDTDDSRPTGQYEPFRPEEEDERPTISPPPLDEAGAAQPQGAAQSKAPPVGPRPGASLPPLPTLNLAQLKINVLAKAREIAADAIASHLVNKTPFAKGKDFEVPLIIDTKTGDIKGPDFQGSRLNLQIVVSPKRNRLFLREPQKQALNELVQKKGRDPNLKLIAQALLAIDDAELHSPLASRPLIEDLAEEEEKTNPRFQIPTEHPTEPPKKGSSDKTPAAGADHTPSASAATAGALSERDLEDAPTNPKVEAVTKPEPKGEVVEDTSQSEINLIYFPSGFDSTEPQKTGSLLELPRIAIRGGERKADGVPILREVIAEYGELVAVTEQGVGSKERNDDIVGRVFGKDGSLTVLTLDGAGGEGDGRDASHTAMKELTEEIAGGVSVPAAFDLAHHQLLTRRTQTGQNSYTTAMATQIRLPAAGLPYTAQIFWAGDSTCIVLRKVNGKWMLLFRTLEDNYARNFVDADPKRDAKPIGRTMQILTHKLSDKLTNALGIPNERMTARTMNDGEWFPLATKVSLEDGSTALAVEPGDLFLQYSDGLRGNYGRTQQILDLIQNASSAEAALELLHRDSLTKMHFLKEAREDIELQLDKILNHGKQHVPVDEENRLKRFPFSLEGKEYFINGEHKIYLHATQNIQVISQLRTPIDFMGRRLHIDADGSLYESKEGGLPVEHFNTDNFGAAALLFNSLESLPPYGQDVAPKRKPSPPPLPTPGSRPRSPVPPPARHGPRSQLGGVAMPKVPPLPVQPGAASGPAPSIPVDRPKSSHPRGKIWGLEEDKPTVVGRSPQARVHLEGDPNINKEHFRIYKHKGLWYLEDLKSSNGTTVNKSRVIKPVPLKDGDIVRAGRHSLNFHLLAGKPFLVQAYHFVFGKNLNVQTIGSSPQANHHLLDAQTSATHLEVYHDGNHWQLRDIGTKTGTRLNGQQIRHPTGQPGNWQTLRDGDLLNIGQIWLRASVRDHLELNQVFETNPVGQAAPSVPPAGGAPPNPGGRSLPPPAHDNARLDGNILILGPARIIRFRQSKLGQDLFLEDVNLQSYILGVKKARFGFLESEWATLEQSDGGRYKLNNLAVKKGIRVQSAAGRDSTIAVGRSDYVARGDTLSFDGLSYVLR